MSYKSIGELVDEVRVLERKNAALKAIIKDLHKIDTDDYDVQGHVPVIDWDKILKKIGGEG